MARLNRRSFILALLTPLSIAEETPKNQVAIAGNAVNAAWVRWADAFNRLQPRTIDVGECAAADAVSATIRKWEHARTAWIRGL